ncbi:MAG TPA: Gfo/Idh/MocA family oxidoreductase, partial [Candidatus Hydrogenedentes bacterium]|nr:Gfo/Idh/MocA family oxidoreductase [Candidatus Hydrogenedentota bacterium]
MQQIRIGIVGLGGICRTRHVPGLRKIDGVEIVVVANRSRESGERAAREFDIPEVAESWRDVVAREDIDAVLIGTWPYMHREVSIAALNAGKHVFCQARMAMDYAEAREMRDAARRSSRVAMLCPV